MPFIDKLERIFGRFSIPGISLVLVVGQVLAWLAMWKGVIPGSHLVLIPAAVSAGQWWRLFSFMLLPPPSSPYFVAFAWWIFYLMGTALEGFWGTFRYNLFLLAGYCLTVAVGFVFPYNPVTNLFLFGSVFLAFAYLNPDFELAIFFILPIRIKWLALIMWLQYAWSFFQGGPAEELQIVAAVGNFALFFWHDLWLTLRRRSRDMTVQATKFAGATRADDSRHRCRVCGKTDKTDPQMDFRYCSRCADDACYCQDHIFNHVHVTAEDEAKKTK